MNELRRRAEVVIAGQERGAAWLLRRDLARRSSLGSTPGAEVHGWEARHRSQNGEDGIIAGLLERIGVTNRVAVEIGSSDGEENCTRHLVDQGWSAIWFEGDPERAEHAATVAGPAARVRAGYVTAENVVALLDGEGCPAEPDVLVIDVDGNDLYLMDRVCASRRPRLLVAEYNASFPPPRRWTVPYDATRAWDLTRYFGASLMSLDDIARRHGYALAGCDSTGVNAFWVRDDLTGPVAELLGGPSDHYVPPRYFPAAMGHPRARVPVIDVPELPHEQSSQVGLDDLQLTSRRVPRGAEVLGTVVVTNGTIASLASSGPRPVTLALTWADVSGRPVAGEPRRSMISMPLAAGARRLVGVESRAPVAAGSYDVRVEMVQEGVRWWPEAVSPRQRIVVT